MERNGRETFEASIPVEALCEVLDHYWQEEARSYRAEPRDSHIFRELVAIANWLGGGTSWDAEEYAASAAVMPEMGWRAAGIAGKALPPESRLPRPGLEPEAAWVQRGGARYEVRGRKPSVLVIVGWDRPMSTFFAQVWDVPDGATHHEQGKLLLWLGTSLFEVEEVGTLAEAVRPFVTLPDDLITRLAEVMVFGA